VNKITKLELILDTIKSLAVVPTLDALLDTIVDQSLEFTGAERGFILMTDDGVSVEFLVAREMEQGDILGQDSQISLSVVNDVLRSGNPIVFVDAPGLAAREGRESILSLQLQSIMCAPLKLPVASGAKTILGVIYVDSRNPARPFNRDDLETFGLLASQAAIIIESARLREQLKRENAELRRQIRGRFGFEAIIGTSEAIQRALRLAEKVAPTDASVVIIGESGTGKELVARAIHQNSPRVTGPFLGINCSTLAESILEAELFGIEAGVATGVKARTGLFEQAGGGTLFLDEVADMPLSMQAKILRVLQNRQLRRVGGRRDIAVDVRVLCATNKELWEEVQAGRFREDLFYRLDVVTIEVPPLRRRPGDIELLATYFLRKFAQKAGANITGFTPGCIAALQRYNWPGNVRELENQIERAVILSEQKTVLDVDDLSSRIKDYRPDQQDQEPGEASATLKDAVAQLERRMLLKALEETWGNKTQAAKLLDISREGLRQKMNLYGIKE